MSSLSTPVVLALFALSGVVIWWAGGILASTTDAIDAHVGWGEGLGGAVFLAIATNLPEVAIIAAGAYSGDLSLAVGNILGGIAIQTVVLVILDGPGLRSHPPLTSVVGSLTIVLQGLALIVILMLCMLGALSPPSLIFARTTPAEIAILLAWFASLWIVQHNEDRRAWRIAREELAEASPVVAPAHHARPLPQVIALFALAAFATLVCGVVLALSSETAAARFHVSGVFFGATVLSAVTALPELTTGLYAVRSGKYELAMSDIVGGNAFLPVLFLFGTLLSNKAILPDAQGPDLYLTALGALLTAIYCVGVILRSNRLLLGAGVDSILVLVLYVLGIAGLVVIAH
ncbi:MAG TPA: hypothetical protein VHT53_14045 [Candidatus Elarobacter sp.]|nr:hypothetical protein [Candidatus Elarobacter sp.]